MVYAIYTYDAFSQDTTLMYHTSLPSEHSTVNSMVAASVPAVTSGVAALKSSGWLCN
jgi:hypothetical protein